jgi:hypothetical protein
MPTDFARCVIRHPDGRWLYHLPGATEWGGPGAVLADGQPMTQIAERSPWWAADHEATRITLVRDSRPKTTGYTLENPDTASVRFPAELTVEDWNDRRADATTAEKETLWNLYRAETVEQDPTEEHIDGPFVVLDGTEPPAGGPAWQVNLRDSITQRPEYAHLFPGRLLDLRPHMADVLKRLPRVQYVFPDHKNDPRVYVSLRVPYAEPETVWVADTSRRTGKPLKTGRTRQVTVDRVLWLPIPHTVPGENYADALADWNAQVDYWTSAVTDASVAACNHCHGTGHVPTGAEQYTNR